MGDFNTAEFKAIVYDLVRQIPAGKVLTYGKIAQWAGYPSYARMVGRAMHEAPDTEDLTEAKNAQSLPCHRVVNSNGRTVPGWTEQHQLLAAEGVCFKRNGEVNLRECLWIPDEL